MDELNLKKYYIVHSLVKAQQQNGLNGYIIMKIQDSERQKFKIISLNEIISIKLDNLTQCDDSLSKSILQESIVLNSSLSKKISDNQRTILDDQQMRNEIYNKSKIFYSRRQVTNLNTDSRFLSTFNIYCGQVVYVYSKSRKIGYACHIDSEVILFNIRKQTILSELNLSIKSTFNEQEEVDVTIMGGLKDNDQNVTIMQSMAEQILDSLLYLRSYLKIKNTDKSMLLLFKGYNFFGKKDNDIDEISKEVNLRKNGHLFSFAALDLETGQIITDTRKQDTKDDINELFAYQQEILPLNEDELAKILSDKARLELNEEKCLIEESN